MKLKKVKITKEDLGLPTLVPFLLTLISSVAATPRIDALQCNIIDLETLGGNCSHAWGINNSGQVADYSTTIAPATIQGFIWENGTMRSLWNLGWDVRFALGINDCGQTVGYTSTMCTASTDSSEVGGFVGGYSKCEDLWS